MHKSCYMAATNKIYFFSIVAASFRWVQLLATFLSLLVTLKLTKTEKNHKLMEFFLAGSYCESSCCVESPPNWALIETFFFNSESPTRIKIKLVANYCKQLLHSMSFPKTQWSGTFFFKSSLIVEAIIWTQSENHDECELMEQHVFF